MHWLYLNLTSFLAVLLFRTLLFANVSSSYFMVFIESGTVSLAQARCSRVSLVSGVILRDVLQFPSHDANIPL